MPVSSPAFPARPPQSVHIRAQRLRAMVPALQGRMLRQTVGATAAAQRCYRPETEGQGSPVLRLAGGGTSACDAAC
jgi:hypothetical protein